MHEESQSGDGPHPPAVGSAHHIVKQSEGHWQAAAASVLSTFIAVDVCFLFKCFLFFFFLSFCLNCFSVFHIDIYLYVSKGFTQVWHFFVYVSLSKKAFILRFTENPSFTRLKIEFGLIRTCHLKANEGALLLSAEQKHNASFLETIATVSPQIPSKHFK